MAEGGEKAVLAAAAAVRRPPIKFQNFVFAANLLLPGYRMPLEDIARRFKGAQYEPNKFAAVILKLETSTGKPTILVFGPGKIVVVTGQTESDVLLQAQMVRVILEMIPFVAMSDDGKQVLFNQTLKSRTVFLNPRIHNIVGNLKLDVVFDLDAIAREHPAACKYEKETFPHLRTRIWLNPQYKCLCGSQLSEEDKVINAMINDKSIKIPKCQCSIKLLVFKHGQFVFTGGRSVYDMNVAYWCAFDAFIPRFAILPCSSSSTAPASITTAPTTADQLEKEAEDLRRRQLLIAKTPTQSQEQYEQNMIQVLDKLPFRAFDVACNVSSSSSSSLTPLMRMCEQKRSRELIEFFSQDQKMLEARDAHGLTVFERVKDAEILAILEKKRRKTE